MCMNIFTSQRMCFLQWQGVSYWSYVANISSSWLMSHDWHALTGTGWSRLLTEITHFSRMGDNCTRNANRSDERGALRQNIVLVLTPICVNNSDAAHLRVGRTVAHVAPMTDFRRFLFLVVTKDGSGQGRFVTSKVMEYSSANIRIDGNIDESVRF